MENDPKILEELSCTQKMRGSPVTHKEGAASIQRLINSRFSNADCARVSIPVRADDDDVIASDYAKECVERIDKLEATNKALLDALNEVICTGELGGREDCPKEMNCLCCESWRKVKIVRDAAIAQAKSLPKPVQSGTMDDEVRMCDRKGKPWRYFY